MSNVQTNDFFIDHPKNEIKALCEQVVKDKYGLDWGLHIVRQSRQIKDSELTHIDYAIPCFELASKLRLKPEEISREISNSIAYEGAQAGWLGGYINFMLTDNKIKDTITNLNNWAEVTNDNQLIRKSYLFLYEDSLFKDKCLGINVIEYLRTTGKKFLDTKCTYVLHDSSEYAEKYYTEHLKNIDPMKYSYSFHKTIRLLLSGERSDTSELGKSFKQLSETVQTLYADKFPVFADAAFLLKESSAQTHTHDFLEGKLLQNVGPIELTIQNRGVFIHSMDGSYALRSIEGYLYSDAYSAYFLHALISECLANGMDNAVVVAPYHKHELISYLIKKFDPDSKIEITLFDPYVSLADMNELAPVVRESGYELYEKIIDVMQSDKNISRAELLQLLDYPVDIMHSLQSNKLPQFFDLLNTTYRLLHSKMH